MKTTEADRTGSDAARPIGPTACVAIVALLIGSACARAAQERPFPELAESCSVELTNRSGDAADVWYDPGHELVGPLSVGQTLVFDADCGHGSLAIYGEHHNAAGGRSGLTCAKVSLRPGETVEASLNSPREICHDPAYVR